MADVTPTRRSGRARVPNRRYTNDAFEGLEIQGTELYSSSSSENGSQQGQATRHLADEEEVSDESDFAKENPEPEDDEDEEEESDDEQSDGASDEDSDASAENEQAEPNDGDIVLSPSKDSPDKPRGGSRYETRYENIVGHNHNDLQLFKQTTELWGDDLLLPSRIPDSGGSGGLTYPARYNGESREQDSADGWTWYYEERGQEQIAKKQNVRTLSSKESLSFYPQRWPSHPILMGPYGQQREFSVRLGSSIHLQNTWPPLSDSKGLRRTAKDGWVVNLGAPIRHMSWAPNHGGLRQYLAVALYKLPPKHHPKHDVYHPSEPWDSCIEIWEFRAEDGPGGKGFMDPAHPPRRVHVICASWGLVRHFKWCPIARIPRMASETLNESESIGLLAGVWSDGRARVVDVRIPIQYDSERIHKLYADAAVTVVYPKRVCTAVDWKSDREFYVGVSSGEMLQLDIAQCLQEQTVTPVGAAQFLTHLPQSYTVKIASFSPHLPNLVVSATVDGHVTMIDMRDPTRAMASAPRLRHPTTLFECCPQFFGLLEVEDDMVGIRGWRTFSDRNHRMVRLDSAVTSLSCGKTHACVLVGSASGKLVAIAPLRVLIAPRKLQCQLPWFVHEWVERKPSAEPTSAHQTDSTKRNNTVAQESTENQNVSWPDPPSQTANTATHEDSSSGSCHEEGPILRPGLSRITENYNPEPLKDLTRDTKGINRKKTAHGYDYQICTTIYEEESAITHLDWNPNVYVGGWAAAAMGSGLLRVEDLAT